MRNKNGLEKDEIAAKEVQTYRPQAHMLSHTQSKQSPYLQVGLFNKFLPILNLYVNICTSKAIPKPNRGFCHSILNTM